MSIPKLIKLSCAARLCPAPHPSPNALWRWGRKGLKTRGGRRVHLKLYRVGGKLLTTEEDLFRFFELVALADQEHFAQGASTTAMEASRCRTASQRDSAIAAANARVEKEGI